MPPKSMVLVRFIAQLWLQTAALPSLSLAATCSAEDPSCHADSFLQVGLTMSHGMGSIAINGSDSSATDAAVTALAQGHREWRTVVAEGLLTQDPKVSYLSIDATAEVEMSITTALHSTLEEYGGRPRLTDQLDRSTLGGRVVYFPIWVWIGIAIFYAASLAHEVYVGCFGGRPLLQNPVPQKSIGLQVLSLWGWMSMLMSTAVNIPLSLDYTISMGMDPVLSGFFLSIGCVTGMVGMTAGRIIFDEKKWSQRALRRWMILLPDVAGLMGLVTFYFLQWVAGQPIAVRRTFWWTSLAVGQLQTLLGSSVNIPGAVIWNKCTPNRDKTFWTMLQQSTKMLGMALGPGVAALVIYGVQGNGERVCPVSMQAWMNLAMMSMNLISGLLNLMYLPVEIPPFDERTMDVTPPSEPPRSPRQPRSPRGAPPAEPVKLEPAPEEFEDKDREKLVWHALQFAFERPLTVAAVEVATVMILEVEYGWPRENTGIVFFIIACLGTVFALVVAILVRRRSIRESYLVFTSGIISVVASLLLFDFTGSAGMWSLLVADPMLFTLALTSWGICEGWAARAVQPGKWYSIETFRMFDGLLMNLGRTISPLIARLLIDMGGRNSYAALQVIVVGLGFHSLRSMCNLFWNLEQKQLDERLKHLQVSDKPTKEELLQQGDPEASPETLPDSVSS
eukprot:TRINITY_DN10637_c0_g1_i1.p1 TRINITY_DN10637_c0_g1~~TRINITY_DN10637_c0_g1_i1.p1  ORF type:complete len:677 (-),score=92.75 TRINITY_DN10637_c0_g1_i1:78-2108(-)